MNNCLRRLPRIMLALLVGLVAMGSVGEMYAQNRVSFTLQNRRAVGTTYYAELWASVPTGQTWRVGGSTINVFYNTAALTANTQAAVFDAHPDLHNVGAYQAMTQSNYGGGTAITITNLSLNNFSEKSGSFKIGTMMWSIADPTASDNLVIAAPPSADPSVVFEEITELQYNCGNNTCYGVVQPLSRIIGLPVITGEPVSATACANQSASFTVSVTGSSLTYQWEYATSTMGTFTAIGGANGATLTINPVTTGNAGAYRVVVSNTTGSVTSGVVTLDVNTTPVITSQPMNYTACAGGNAVFTVAYTSTLPASVQWQVFDDVSADYVDLDGETSATLTINNVNTGMQGVEFRALLTNGCGVVTSNVATINVNVAPTVTMSPSTAAGCVGTTVEFSAVANGTPVPTVQWQVSTDGSSYSDIAGATAATLSLANVQTSQNGNLYRAVFTNNCGVATTGSASLMIYTAPVVTTAPASQTACEGTSVSFNAAASGTPAPAIQWQMSTDNGAQFNSIAGATSATLSLTNVTASQNGYQYRAVFTNVCSTVNSVAATLNVNTAPVVTAQPSNQTVCEGGSASFMASAASTPAPSVQWQVNNAGTWENVLNATTNTLTVSNLVFAQNGTQYRAVFANVCGTTTSSIASVTVNRAPQTASVTPGSQTVCGGTPVTFTASSTGGSPTPTVQWQSRPNSGGTFANITGATNLTLTFTPTVAESGSEYRAIFTNVCGSMTSASVTLTVNTVATVTTQPADQTQCVGGTVTFTAAATGTPAPTVQWQVSTDGTNYSNLSDGGNISGTQTNTLTIMSVAANQTNNRYRAVYTNTCGAVNSNAAILTVNTPPTITGVPASIDTCAGSTVVFTASANATPSATVQWQERIGGAMGTWTNISGATTNTLTLSNVMLAQSGNEYRAVFTNLCGFTATTFATLTVNEGPVVTIDPADAVLCEGDAVTFGSAATGYPTPSVQWEVSSNGGTNWTPILGATASSLTINTTTFAQNGNMYRAVYSNVCGTTMTAAATLTVNTAPVVSVNPMDQTVCAGENATFSAASVASPAATVQWEVSTNGGTNWTPIFGATGTTYTFTAGPNDNGNLYRAVFTNVCGEATTDAAMLNFYALPEITQQPTAVAVCQGGSFTLTVGAVGTGLTYQWRKGGIDIPNATSQNYTVAAASANDAGFYTVVVSNICNQPVESNPVNVVVNLNPVITVQPVPVTVCQGEFAQFFVQTTGTGLSFQWQRNGENIPGATNTFIDIPSAQPADAGSYTVVITGACGTPVVSDAAMLTVETAPVVNTNPASITVCEGEAAVFTVAAGGSNLTYQWQVNGADIAGANDATFTIDATSEANAGNYRVIVTGSCGTPDTSAVAVLTVNMAPVIVSDVQNQTVCEGNDITFTVGATGTDLSYQWYFNGLELPGANGSSLTIQSATMDDAGDYEVVVTGSCPTADEVRSRIATLTVYENVVITVQPQSVSACLTNNILLSVSATGTGFPNTGLTYQWYKDGVPVPASAGGTNNQLTLSNAQYAMSGNYTVVVSGICGSVESQTAIVVVNRPTSAELKEPRNKVVTIGEDVVLEVSDVSGSGVTFQWYKNGVALTEVPGRIVGTKSSKLFIYDVQVSDTSNNYYVVVSGPCGIATSELASINIYDPTLTFDVQPTDEVVCENSQFTLTAQATTNVPGGVITYQWYLNGVAIPGATGQTYTVTSATLANGGTYYVEASIISAGVTTNSGNAAVTVKTAPAIVTQPTSLSFCENENASLTVQINAEAGDVSYQWFKDGQPIDPALNPSATTATLIGPVTALTIGDYTVVAANECGSVTSSAATVSLKAQTVITQQPQNVSLDTLGVSELRLSVVATGENCSYQWKLNGNNIAGATSSEYVVTVPLEADLGNYTVDVICECGTITSSVAVVSGFAVSVGEPIAGEGFYLAPNYPNPFTGLTTIMYQVPTATDVRISVTDMYGREVAVLVNGVVMAGSHTVKFDATQLPSGTYFYTMTASGVNMSRRMLHVK